MKKMRVKSQKQQEEINVLEKKFKYAGLKMSYGLPQDEQKKMQRELCMWKR